MRILWFYKFIPEYDFDNWLHLKFAESISKHKDIEVVCFGPKLHETTPELTKLHYRQDITMDELYNSFNPDVIILNTKSRMFHYYDPHNHVGYDTCWLPKDFKSFKKCPKVVLEEDYHYEKNDEWYREVGIDLILQRHYASSKRQETVPMLWFPFSADTEVFRDLDINRKPRVCVAGSVNGAYPERQAAVKILSKHGLADVFVSKEMIGEQYVSCLQRYVCHLSGSSRYSITPAKMFEIMSSGSILLTNEEKDLELLFDKGSYVTYKPDSFSFELDMLKKVNLIISDLNYRKNIVKLSKDCIKNKHSHFIRIEQLKRIINKLIYGSPFDILDSYDKIGVVELEKY